jgi:hypothetical protein
MVKEQKKQSRPPVAFNANEERLVTENDLENKQIHPNVFPWGR